MLGHPDASAELQTTMGQMVQHSGFFGQPNRVIKWQLVNHDPKTHGGSSLGHRSQVDTRCRKLTYVGILMFDGVIGLIAQFFSHLDFIQLLIIHISRHR